MQQITPQALADWLADESRAKPLLLDVREPWEFEYCHLSGALLMPMHTVPPRLQELQPEGPVVCICHHGGRSMQVGMFLKAKGFVEVYNLAGGVNAWAQVVDPAMRRY